MEAIYEKSEPGIMPMGDTRNAISHVAAQAYSCSQRRKERVIRKVGDWLNSF